MPEDSNGLLDSGHASKPEDSNGLIIHRCTEQVHRQLVRRCPSLIIVLCFPVSESNTIFGVVYDNKTSPCFGLLTVTVRLYEFSAINPDIASTSVGVYFMYTRKQMMEYYVSFSNTRGFQ